MRTLILFRHGEVDEKHRVNFYGQSDVELSEKGKRHSVEVVEILSHLDISAIFSSPLKRALFPATLLSQRKNIPLFVRDDLKEVNYGLWTGRARSEVYRDPLFWERLRDDTITPPGGESIRDLRRRAINFLRYAMGEEGDIGVVFTHGGFLKALICEILNLESRLFYTFEIYYLRALILQFKGKDTIVKGMNVSANDVKNILDGSYW